MPKIILLNRMLHQGGQEWLAARADVEVVPPDAPGERIAQAVASADAVLVRLPIRLTRELVAAAPRLRVIGIEGAGFDHIDVAAATEAGIPVVNNVGVGATPVAEHAVGLMLALARRIAKGNAGLRHEGWACRDAFLGGEMGTELSGKTVGIVGFGAIGRQVARICLAAFENRILAYDPLLDDGLFHAMHVDRRRRLRELLPEADFVTIHTPLNAETRHVIGAAELGLMKPTAYLINCARGPVVDEAALYAALHEGRIAGAGIDVFDPEPPASTNPLFGLPNVIVTPHIAGVSQETSRRLSLAAAEQVMQVLADERPPRLVNPEVWARRRRPT
ncbi:MAG TPA: hydroxyacid dehydrogenase [bacterium]|nr:hydroxyacid dehydrogenase [bacterium]